MQQLQYVIHRNKFDMKSENWGRGENEVEPSRPEE